MLYTSQRVRCLMLLEIMLYLDERKSNLLLYVKKQDPKISFGVCVYGGNVCEAFVNICLVKKIVMCGRRIPDTDR